MVTIETTCLHGASLPHPAKGAVVLPAASAVVLVEALEVVLEVVLVAGEAAVLVVEAPGEAGKMVK